MLTLRGHISAVQEALETQHFATVCACLDALPSGQERDDLVEHVARVMDRTWRDEARSPGWNWDFLPDIEAARCWLPLVRHIERERFMLEAGELRALVDCRALSRLRLLALVRVHQRAAGEGLTRLEVAALGEPGAFPRLQVLDVSDDRLEDSDLVALFGQGAGRALRKLNLSHNPIGTAGVRTLLGSPGLRALRVLRLCDTSLGPDAGAALGRHGGLPALRELDLWGCALGDAGVAALVGGRRFRHLQVLDLGENAITEQGAAALAQALAGPSVLHTLSLGGNPLGDEGVLRLLRGPLPPTLRHLSLHGVGLTDWGAALLEALPGWAHLETLSVGGEAGLSDAMAALIQRPRPGDETAPVPA